MAVQQVQLVHRSLFPQGGIPTALDFDKKGFHEIRLSQRGEMVSECSQQNNLRIHTINCGFTLRPRGNRILAVDQETERVNNSVHTSRNTPTQGNDYR